MLLLALLACASDDEPLPPEPEPIALGTAPLPVEIPELPADTGAEALDTADSGL